MPVTGINCRFCGLSAFSLTQMLDNPVSGRVLFELQSDSAGRLSDSDAAATAPESFTESRKGRTRCPSTLAWILHAFEGVAACELAKVPVLQGQ